MSSEPKILHLITRLLDGGAEAKTMATVSRLEGYQFTVGFGASHDTDQIDRLHDAGAATVCFENMRHYDPLGATRAVVDVARYLRANEFDIVHTHSTEAGIIGRYAAAIARSPSVVHTIHGVPFADDRSRVLERFLLHSERLAARFTDVMVANADAITEDYLARGIGHRSQYETVYSGIDIDEIDRSTPAEDIDGTGTRVLMVGRLASGKGHEDLVEAICLLEQRELSVYLAGEGPLREQIQSIIHDRGLSDTVTMLGYRDDIGSVMAACDLLALPSYREGTPRVITEAMASGLPVIATEIAGIPEQIVDGENGFLLPPGDVAALRTKLEALVDSPELRTRFGAVSRQRVDRFDIERTVVDLDAIYQRLL